MAVNNASSNDSLIRNETLFCQNERFSLSIDGKALHAFVVLYGFFGCFGLLANTLVIFLINTVRLLQNQSMKLLMYLSIVDLYSSAIALIRIPLFINAKKLSCAGLTWSYFFMLVSFYSTDYLFALTGLDRFLRIKYLENYGTKFTPLRFRITFCWYCFFVIGIPFVTTYFNAQHSIGYASKYVLPVNGFATVLTIVLYGLSIYQLRRLRKLNQVISDAIENILKVTIVYLYLFGAFVGGIASYQVILGRSKSLGFRPETMFNVTRLLPSVLGSLNAVAFVVIHPLARRYVASTRFFAWIYTSNRVGEANNENNNIV
eukprot:TCONS_00033264-protein